jgi:hypothetical protein
VSSITGQQTVNQTLTLLAVIQPGETPNTSESNDALSVINNVLDNWAIQRLQNISIAQVSVALTAATQSYVLSPRPPAIYACTFVLATDYGGSATFPVKMLTAAEWGAIVDRDVQANIVKAAFYDRDLSSPTLWLTPIPPGGSIIYSTWTVEAFAQFSDLADSVTLAAGYQRALIAACALELAPQYAVPPANLVQIQQSYAEAMAAIRQLNAELMGPEPPALPPGSQTNAPPTSPSGSPGAA